MKFGFCLPTFSFPDLDFKTAGRIREFATRAEALGFDALWVPEHLLTARLVQTLSCRANWGVGRTPR